MDNIRGITLMTIAMAFFALGDMTIKWATQTLSVGQVLALLGLGGGTAFAIMTRLQGHAVLTADFLRPPILLRNASEIAGTICMVTSLSLIDLSTAAAILQATPLAVTLGAAVFLREPVGWRRWSATIAGFAGVLIIMRPGFAGFEVQSLWAVAAMLALAIRDLSTRLVPRSVPTLRVSTYGMSMLVPGGLILILLGQPFQPMTPGSGGLMMVAVVVGVLGYYAITAAMRVGEVSVVSPFRYTRMVFALAVGILVFAERPDVWTLAGTALTIFAGLYIFLRERHGQRLSAPA